MLVARRNASPPVGFQPARRADVCAQRTSLEPRAPDCSCSDRQHSTHMEVAESQWRREWAGTAEYGKVVEGGVTRRVARAMEVLHASGPGAKVRVMRAAYHSSAGPGLPASSYMMHSSRRVFSSGFNFLEQPPSPTKPLEIASIPYDGVPDHIDPDTENYKVTEPDDFEISEPSKWKRSTSGSLRMPSEESSSTDNASIIDLDLRTSHKNILRKFSCDSENSDITHSGRNSRVSPLLDAPVSLSTLKYKSLLNGSNDWNSRRKSYSFEDTSPLSDSILHSNDTLAMESSTDSGICKSTEIVNDHADDVHLRYFGSKERDINKQDDSFQSWLSKNRQNNNYYKGPKFKSYREHHVVKEEPAENNITLQSTGKVSIALPVKVETDDGYHYQKNDISDDGQRKIKKVEFCKTELHFTVDTGKVNIIATDEKPPPTNDFRKRRSAFVPMHEMIEKPAMIEKPITLFGEKVNDFPDVNHKINSFKHHFSEVQESDENTAATKSILKNKIPKPKPYLLGENMAFGSDDILKDGNENNTSNVLTAVSLINRQLQSDNEFAAKVIRRDAVSAKTDAFRTATQGSPKSSPPTAVTYGFKTVKSERVVRIQDERNSVNLIKDSQPIKRSPTPGARLTTRELRDSDLTYFGIDSQPRVAKQSMNRQLSIEDSDLDEFQSVKLIRRVSSSACNSESEDAPEYMNIPFNTDYAPVPTPRIRTKYDDKPNQIDEINVLKPIIEHIRDVSNDEVVTTRRSKFRKKDELNVITSRSISEPRRSNKFNSSEKTNRLFAQPTRCLRDTAVKENVTQVRTSPQRVKVARQETASEDDSPIYANFDKSGTSNIRKHVSKIDSYSRKTAQQESPSKRDTPVQRSRKLETPPSTLGRSTEKATTSKTTNSNERNDTLENKSKRRNEIQPNKTEKTHNSNQSMHKSNRESYDTKKSIDFTESKYSSGNTKQEHKSRATDRHSTKNVAKDTTIRDTSSSTRNKQINNEKKSADDTETKNSDTSLRKSQTTREKSNTRTEAVKIIPKVENSTIDKSTTNRDVKPRHGSKSRKSEYVINYDDKNGTVSSVHKLRSGSDSPRRKKTSKEVVKEKYKENLKHKTSDKAALLQTEDRQRNGNAIYGERRRKSKAHVQRSCQVL